MPLYRLSIVIALSLLALSTVELASRMRGQSPRRDHGNAPESFTCQAQARTAAAGAATHFRIQIDRYVADVDRTAMTQALVHGGYPGFVLAVRKAPELGRIEFGGQTFSVRWANARPEGNGRAITIVTDKPMYFVGGGQVDSKPREGYELAVVQFRIDEVGMGMGTMAAAARVKSDGQGGVLLEDYAEEPIKLTSVRREIK